MSRAWNRPEDRRKFNIFLTPAGKAIIQEVLPVIHRFRQLAYKNFSDEEMDRLTEILDRVFENLQ